MPQFDLFGKPTPIPGELEYHSRLIPIIDLRDADQSEFEKKIRSWRIASPPDPTLLKKVLETIDAVQEFGDRGFLEMIAKQERGDIASVDSVDDLILFPEQLQRMPEYSDKKFIKAIRIAIQNISMFHIKQHQESWFIEDEETGVRLGQRVTPMDSIAVLWTGLHPIELIMNTIPAKLAGVERIVIAIESEERTLSSLALAVIHELNPDEVILSGGAPVVAALAVGTETIPRVDKIVGVGDVEAQLAKQLLSGQVGIDSFSSCREMVIVGDQGIDPHILAADMLAQCEYSDLSGLILFLTSDSTVSSTIEQLQSQLNQMGNAASLMETLRRRTLIVLVNEAGQAAPWINEIAPQYVHLMIEEADRSAKMIRNAGTILIGEYSSEAIGTFVAGPNLNVPAMGRARFQSPLGIDDFLHHANIIHLTRRKIEDLSRTAETILAKEGFPAHIQSLRHRLQKSE